MPEPTAFVLFLIGIVVHDKNDRAVSVEGREKVLEPLDPNVRAAIKKQLDPEYLAQHTNDELDRIPDKPLSPGDTWELTATLRLDSGQKLTFITEYEYRGTVDDDGKQLDQIIAKTKKVSYSADEDAPLKVIKSDLKVDSSEGVILFDRHISI